MKRFLTLCLTFVFLSTVAYAQTQRPKTIKKAMIQKKAQTKTLPPAKSVEATKINKPSPFGFYFGYEVTPQKGGKEVDYHIKGYENYLYTDMFYTVNPVETLSLGLTTVMKGNNDKKFDQYLDTVSFRYIRKGLLNIKDHGVNLSIQARYESNTMPNKSYDGKFYFRSDAIFEHTENFSTLIQFRYYSYIGKKYLPSEGGHKSDNEQRLYIIPSYKLTDAFTTSFMTRFSRQEAGTDTKYKILFEPAISYSFTKSFSMDFYVDFTPFAGKNADYTKDWYKNYAQGIVFNYSI